MAVHTVRGGARGPALIPVLIDTGRLQLLFGGLLAAGLWPAYLIWELIVSEDRPDANIRIDLLVIYPVLVVMTAVGVWTGRRARGTRARKGRAR